MMEKQEKQDTQLDRIESQLKRLEQKVDRSSKSTLRQWYVGLGLGLIVGSAGLVNTAVWISVVMFIGGYLFIVLPPNWLQKH